MLPLVNSLLASVVVLAVLVWIIALPFFAAWWLLSVRKSLARIADSLSGIASHVPEIFTASLGLASEAIKEKTRGISTSAFGR